MEVITLMIKYFQYHLKFSLMILHLYHFGFFGSYPKIHIYSWRGISEIIFQYEKSYFIDNIINISKYTMQKCMKYIYDILRSIFYNIYYIYINIFYILCYTYIIYIFIKLICKQSVCRNYIIIVYIKKFKWTFEISNV